jgi:hypothetical protein
MIWQIIFDLDRTDIGERDSGVLSLPAGEPTCEVAVAKHAGAGLRLPRTPGRLRPVFPWRMGRGTWEPRIWTVLCLGVLTAWPT